MKYLEKVHQFRNYIWENIDFLVSYSNYQLSLNQNIGDKKTIPRGKIDACINSAGDWLTIAAEGLDGLHFDFNSESTACLQLMQLISYIHIVFQAIKDINKIVDNTTNSAEQYYDKSEIFSDYPYEMSDNDYFRNIRAAFGEHSTDLHFKKKKDDKQDTYYFSSWPVMRTYRVNDTLSYDFYLLIYEKGNDDKFEVFGFRLEDLYTFLNRNIEFLEDIKGKIEELKKNYKKLMINGRLASKDNYIEKIDMLIKENEKRLSNDYYDTMLKDLRFFYSVEYQNEDFALMLSKYKSKLDELLMTLEDNIQNMVVNELTQGRFLDFNSHDQKISKEFSDLVNNIYGKNKNKFVFYNDLYSYINERTQIDIEECKKLNDVELYCLLIIVSNMV